MSAFKSMPVSCSIETAGNLPVVLCRRRCSPPPVAWLGKPLDAITRRDIESRFHMLTEHHGAVPANQCLSFLRSVYRRPCVDHEGLHNPVGQWLAGGGRYHRKTRKRILRWSRKIGQVAKVYSTD